MADVYWLKTNCLFVQIEEDGVLRSVILDLEENTHYRPTENAAFILCLMASDQGIKKSDLINKLKQKYQNITDQDIENAITTILSKRTGASMNKEPVVLTKDVTVGPPDVAFDVGVRKDWRTLPAPDIKPHGTVCTIGKVIAYKPG